MHDIRDISRLCEGDNTLKKSLFALIFHEDDRVGYNALWIMTHFSKDEISWFIPLRDDLTDYLLKTNHTGKKRLTLTLLDRLPISEENIRTDYLNYCLSAINSNESYGIRALCLKQSYKLCRFYPELMDELKNEIELMDYNEQSPGLAAALRNVRKNISK